MTAFCYVPTLTGPFGVKDYRFFKDTYISRSWGLGVEFNANNGTKGHAKDFIKEHCGALISIGIGDYDNDLTLVQQADLGVAVANAVDELKKSAD